jgi:hypothetical protein
MLLPLPLYSQDLEQSFDLQILLLSG